MDKCVSQENILWEACKNGAVQSVAFLLQTKQALEFVSKVNEIGETGRKTKEKKETMKQNEMRSGEKKRTRNEKKRSL